MSRRNRPDAPVPGLTWARPKSDRQRRTSLDRETAVAAAIAILDEEGVAGLSMRKLGDRLGTAATTLYWHVSNKEELLDLAFDHVMQDLSVDATDDWRSDVRHALDALRAMALRHRWYPSLYSTRPSVGPHALRFWGGLLDVLASSGFSGADLDNAFCMLSDYVVGSAAIHLSYDTWLGSDQMAIEQIHDYVRDAVAAQPTYTAYIEDYISKVDAATRRDRRHEFAVECMLDSLSARLAALHRT